MVQVSMKQEMELAMKLLEKDIHEKQDTLIGLRQQLDEVKAINVEMYQKMQVRLEPSSFLKVKRPYCFFFFIIIICLEASDHE